MNVMKRRCAAGVLGLALLAGCAGSPGPVYGEWQGTPPSGRIGRVTSIDLVLKGPPDAQSGEYHISSTDSDPTGRFGDGERQWGGAWTSQQRVVDGRTVKFIKLHDHLTADIGDYALEADGRLHALDPNGALDMKPVEGLYTLSPVPPRGIN